MHVMIATDGTDAAERAVVAALELFGPDAVYSVVSIGVPIPTRWTERFSDDLDLLKRVADRIGVEVHVLDDRFTPDWTIPDSALPEPDESDCELLSWRLASALSNRWPTSLGRVVETHDCGGFYDQIQLQPLSDRSLDWPAPRPRRASCTSACATSPRGACASKPSIPLQALSAEPA